MKVFQILHKYPPYINHFLTKYDVRGLTFEEHRDLLVKDRFYAAHILTAPTDSSDNAFYTMWNYRGLQIKWAQEKGYEETDLKKIVLAQIEEYQPDVFYSFSPTFFDKDFLNQIDSKIVKVCWSASPDYDNELFKLYQTRLTNLPLDVKTKEEIGFRSDLFHPAFDPAMEDYAKNINRPIDIFFYGQYHNKFFDNRNALVDQLIEFKNSTKLNVQLAIMYNEQTEPVKAPVLNKLFKKTVYPPKAVRKAAAQPQYGLDLYKKIGDSKIVFNAGVDFSKNHKVNMRNFEVLGCGAFLLSDQGIYPPHFEEGKHFDTYTNVENFIEKAHYYLEHEEERSKMAKAGHEMIKTNYSKDHQWENFQQIIGSL